MKVLLQVKHFIWLFRGLLDQVSTLLWKILDVHIAKIVFFTILAGCLSEVCTRCWFYRRIYTLYNTLFSREEIFAKKEFEIFSREDIFANILFTRKYLPAKISSRENFFSRKYLPAKLYSRELFPGRKYVG